MSSQIASFRPRVIYRAPSRQSKKQVVDSLSLLSSLGGCTFRANVVNLRKVCAVGRGRQQQQRCLPCRAEASIAPGLLSTDDAPVNQLMNKLKGEGSPPLSDIVWAAIGAFAAMAGFAYMDRALAPRGLSMTLGSFGAVCCLLFAAPKAPVSQKWNVIMGHAGCALIAVAALSLFGPGWVAKGAGLAACVAYMQFTSSMHPPAAGLPLILIDAPKWHALKWWYILFPGVVGCLYLFILQEMVEFMKENVKF